MDSDLIFNLLNKLKRDEYLSVLRNISQGDKRFQTRTVFAGFSMVEKVPVRIVANKASTNKAFLRVLLKSISAIVLSETNINMEMDINEIKTSVPKTQWLGLAAAFLLTGMDEHSREAAKIVAEFEAECNVKENTVIIQNSVKAEKKEEKFRSKYMKALGEISELKTNLAKHEERQQQDLFEIDQLRKRESELEATCTTLKEQMNKLCNENKALRCELKNAKAKTTFGHIDTVQANLLFYAPNCKDVLDRFCCDSLTIDFGYPSDFTESEILEKYDEIWICSNFVPYGTYKKYCKCRQHTVMKIFIFETVNSLIAHAKKFVR